ncbi:MAG: hypothetical protein ACRCYV_10780, partial [Aeromonas sp.]
MSAVKKPVTWLDQEPHYYHQDSRGHFATLVLFADGSYKHISYRMGELNATLAALAGQSDCYISQASFRSKSRALANLDQLKMLFLDLDCYKDGWQGVAPEEMVWHVLYACEQVKVMLPSLIVF